MITVAIDRGGTFTDLIAFYNGKIYTKKVLSQSSSYKDSNTYAIKELLKEIFNKEFTKIDPTFFSNIKLGTTVATNALLERKGADVTLIVTKGFKDILEIRYQDRQDLFALNPKKSKPLYKEVIEVNERVLPTKNGFKVLKKLKKIPKPKYNVAVTLLHSYGYKEHEKLLKKHFKNSSISSEIMPTIKAIDRADTTVVDAYLNPIIKSYIKNIIKEFSSSVSNKLYFIKSDGGVCKAHEFRGANSLLSGPAGGVVALSKIYKNRALIGFDMGGTSTDVSRFSGEIELKYSQKIAGCYINYPSVDIHTVASGGGSRLFFKDGMFLVGPKSSGANPGPLCYGKDGFLSITDANLVTNRLDLDSFPKIFGKDNSSSLNKEAAINGFRDIAKKVNRSIFEVAQAFIDVANENMANAIKEITIKKGYKPSEHILCSFGGAGGQHVVGVARKLGIKEIFIHKNSGILSAFGILQADEKKEKLKAIEQPLDKVDLNSAFKSLIKDSSNYDIVVKSLLLKYKDTNEVIEVKYKDNFLEQFKKRYKEIFGFNLKNKIVVQDIKVTFIKRGKEIKRPKIKNSKTVYKDTKIFLNGKWQKAKVYSSLAINQEVKGPALILQDSSTILLDEASFATINEYGDISIELKKSKENFLDIKEAKLSLYSNKVRFIATKMGDILQKSAISTNIKQRADFSCAIFDSNGDLIANAPHIPVHLGSMSSVVKAIIKKFPKINNSTYITNTPYEGGSHLPDITVVTPYIKNGKILFWVASRGHHADIGGKKAGSMPPFSKSLKEEGAIIEAFEIVKDGKFFKQKILKILKKAKARNISDNISDIKAQIAANYSGISELKKLNYKDLEWYFKQIKKVSNTKIKSFFKKFKNQTLYAKEYLDNGAKIELSIKFKQDKAIFDFTNSSCELLSNQNAPTSVVRSAVLYALRVMLNDDIPLNDGILESVKIKLKPNSLLNPSKDAAIVGGNVTTSQRIVDVIFSAFKVSANSHGCMNNVIFGNKNFGYYETIGGGSGATKFGNGVSAIHTHMTNTKITDVEILEHNYPIYLKEFSIRKNSAGEGKFRGGDGIVRKYCFLEELDVSILTERRVLKPNGLNGGKSAKRGKNILKRGKKRFNLTSKASFKAKVGDTLIIKTPGGGGYGYAKE